jgi:hypothetical protein
LSILSRHPELLIAAHNTPEKRGLSAGSGLLRPEVSSVGSVDSCSFGAGINAGPLLRSINKAGRISGDGFTPKVIWANVKANAKSCGLATIGPHEVALAWLRHQTVPVIPIIGARKVSRLQDNLASLDLELSAEQLKSVDGASRIDLGFPQSIYERETVRAVRYGGDLGSLAALGLDSFAGQWQHQITKSALLGIVEKVRPFIDICHLSC